MLEIGDVVAMPLPLGGWGACQVTALRNRLLLVCTLAWHSASPPALDDLRGIGPLIVDHHNWGGEPMAMSVDADEPLPADFVLLGPLPVSTDLPRESDTLGSWSGKPMQVVLQRHWDLRLPDEAKAAYKSAPAGLVEVDLGGGPPMRKAARLDRLDLRERHGEVRWAGLDSLAQVTGLLWAGPARGLVEALESRPLITYLAWEDPPDEVDLGKTGLHALTLGGLAAPRRLTLPPELMGLRLEGGAPELVTAESDGRWIRLATTGVPVPEGLRGVRSVEVEVAGDLPVAAVEGLQELESLQVRWMGPYGGLGGLPEPARLRTLELTDAYGVTAEMLPSPEGPLRRLTVDCLRSSQVRPIRQRYKGSEVVVRLGRAKSDRWLAINIDNPLRDWVDEDRRGGEAACRAYAVAERAVGLLASDDDPAAVADARGVLREFVEALNTVEERHRMIDTVMREEAGAAFMGLAERAGVPRAEAASWFNEWRDF